MKIIDAINHKNVRFTLFPDNQPHIDLVAPGPGGELVPSVIPGEEVLVRIRLTTANEVMHLLQISNALDNIGARKKVLDISYLMGARYDRSMRTGDSVDLEVISGIINSCKFPFVRLFDVHSVASLRLIDNSYSVNNRELVEAYRRGDAVLICPDTGAERKVADYVSWNPCLTSIKYCTKKRDLDTGAIQLKLLDEDRACQNRNCVIIDDICDGGATFLAIAAQIFCPKSLTLIVSHGIFSKGLRSLQEKFDEIITTDSYQLQNPADKLKVIKLYGH